jgi:superfamily I DNA/RNA helicase
MHGKVEIESKRELTVEQLAIINSSGNIVINAVAGSGKTTTVIEYAATRPPHSKILYLAFNKSVKLEASRRFQERNLLNVRVETAHSLAFSYVMRGNKYKVRSQSYKTYELAELLGLTAIGEKHGEHIIANHINKFITYFCNSDVKKVQELNYLDIVADKKARAFANSHYAAIEKGTRMILAMMERAEIEISHDFYLKKFQLSNPQLPFDYILFDEAQDASPAMLDVFLNQKSTKIIVGDTHQQIYGWRHAINSLEKTGFESLDLTTSFRFGNAIADLAMNILAWKLILGKLRSIKITGKGKGGKPKTRATIARTNLGLLLNAIGYVTDHPKTKRIYFEGNINSYTYADDGASLYDVLNLYNNNHDRIKDKLVRSMKDMDDLEEYIEKTEDQQLSMMVEIVNEYGNEIPGILKSLKSLHVENDKRHDAEMIFSTVHRAKGMEYDEVYLVNDFINEKKLEKMREESKKSGEPVNLAKVDEEINLLYVAVTRTKHVLNIPESLLPSDQKEAVVIKIVKAKADPEQPASMKSIFSDKIGTGTKTRQGAYPERSNSSKLRDVNSSYQPWTSTMDKKLKRMNDRGHTISEMASNLERTKGAIIARLRKLGLDS